MSSKQRRAVERRSLLWVLSSVAFLVGVASLTLGVYVQVTPEPVEATPLGPGAPFTVPSRVTLAGDLVVYGTPPAGGRPELDELGCSLTSGGGELSTEDAANEDRIVVEGAGVVPLATFPGVPGHSIACNGPAAVASVPLYVVPGGNSRHLVPLGGFSTAALMLPVGAMGLLMLRGSRP